jgi:putative Holliday junction resolvase
MGRIICLDFGGKRTGIAVTDPLRIIASPLETVLTEGLLDYMTRYCTDNQVDIMVVGLPLHADGNPTQLEEKIQLFIAEFTKKFPLIEIARQDETLTSKMAADVMIRSGMPKKKRQDKANLDLISAVIILQQYLKY